MHRLIFDTSPVYFILCLGLGAGYAFLLYSSRYSWEKWVNRILFVMRAFLVTALMLLLLGPILKQTKNIFEKPVIAFLIDNSRSVKETADTAALLSQVRQVAQDLEKQNRIVDWSGLRGERDSLHFNGISSDLATGLRETISRYEGKNLAGIVLVSDGIYNNGLSPVYLPLRIPVYTVGAGDTTERADVVIRNVDYNRIVYQGNKFPVHVEVGVTGLSDEDIIVSVIQQGKILQRQKNNSGKKSLLAFDFQLDAVTQGIQRLEIRAENLPRETNLKNNRASAFVEVVEGKKKIILLAPSPHPDLKALRSVIEKNSNYELIIHIPGIQEADPALLLPGKFDLLIAHQGPDINHKTTSLLASLLKAKSSALIVIGQMTMLNSLPSAGVPAGFEPTSQRDDVLAVLNPGFRDFGFPDNMNTVISRFPPVLVPFGKFSFPATAKIILQQRIGSVVTERPLLYAVENEGQKIAVFTGEGLWKWRLNEYQENEKTAVFDELFSKLIQYLSTRDDRRKFRCFPLQHEFTSESLVVFESQVYNDLFEPVFGNTIDLEVRDEQGVTTNYRYVTGPGNNRYRIAGLREGVYRYRAMTDVQGKKEEVRGEFLLSEQNQEEQNLTADFGMLRKLAENTGGKFYPLPSISRLSTELTSAEVRSLIHSEESFYPLINLKAVFFILLTLISAEWFIRKFMGSY